MSPSIFKVTVVTVQLIKMLILAGNECAFQKIEKPDGLGGDE